MIYAGNHACPCSQTDSHINIAHLRHRRKCDHSADTAFLDGAQGTEYHSHQAKYKQYIDNMGTVKYFKTDYTINNLNQKKNITFGCQGGQYGRRRYRGIPIGIRQPCMKRKQSAFDSQSHNHQGYCNHQRDGIGSVGHNHRNLYPYIGHQKMPCQIIQHTQTDQQKP